jgi:hemerythrin
MEPIILNHKSIDDQHATLIGIYNSLEFLLSNESKLNVSNLFPIIVSLVNYAKFHFYHEHELMEEYNYTESVRHIHGHDEFIDMVTNSLTTIDNVNIVVFSKSLKAYLELWINNHIKIIDKQLVDFINSRPNK